MDGFTGHEADLLSFEVQLAGRLADQVHLHPALVRVPARFVAKVLQGQVSPEFLVDPGEQVHVERGRQAVAIIVGPFQGRAVLCEVHADQEPAPRPRVARHFLEKFRRLAGHEVADGGTRKVEGPPPFLRACFGQRHGPQVVGTKGKHLQGGVLLGDGLGGVQQMFAGDIDGHVARGLVHGIEQQPGLLAAAAAVLHEEDRGPEPACHVGGVLSHDPEFGSCGVVVVGLADGLEGANPNL